jgi:hypothetical protein
MHTTAENQKQSASIWPGNAVSARSLSQARRAHSSSAGTGKLAGKTPATDYLDQLVRWPGLLDHLHRRASEIHQEPEAGLLPVVHVASGSHGHFTFFLSVPEGDAGGLHLDQHHTRRVDAFFEPPVQIACPVIPKNRSVAISSAMPSTAI